MTDKEYRALLRLPDQIVRAEQRLQHLYAQAARLGLPVERKAA